MNKYMTTIGLILLAIGTALLLFYFFEGDEKTVGANHRNLGSDHILSNLDGNITATEDRGSQDTKKSKLIVPQQSSYEDRLRLQYQQAISGLEQEKAAPQQSDKAPAKRTELTNVETLIKAIHENERGGSLSEKLIKEIQNIAAKEDDLVEELIAGYERAPASITEVVHKQVMLEAVAAAGGQRAREFLLDKAMQTDPAAGSIAPTAARYYSKLVEGDAEAIAELLDSTSRESRWVGLKELERHRLSRQVIDQIGNELLSSDQLGIRLSAVQALVTDRSMGNGEQKVEFILGAAEKSSALEGANQPAYGSNWLVKEEFIRHAAFALPKIDEGEQHLRQIADSPDDALRRHLAIVSLGLGGEASVRPQLHRMIKTEKEDVIRELAVEALGKVGGEEDVAMLQQLAAGDPSRRVASHRGGGDWYPVREAAERSLRRIKSR